MKRILIVDDDEEIVNSLMSALSRNFQVVGATSGSQALRYVLDATFDAVLLDVDLSGGATGIEVAEYIRRYNVNVRLFLFSALDYSDAVRSRAIELGATFFEKPLPLKDLISSLGS